MRSVRQSLPEPSNPTKTLSLFTSRWIIFLLWRNSKASRHSCVTAAIWPSSRTVCSTICVNWPPFMYSITTETTIFLRKNSSCRKTYSTIRSVSSNSRESSRSIGIGNFSSHEFHWRSILFAVVSTKPFVWWRFSCSFSYPTLDPHRPPLYWRARGWWEESMSKDRFRYPDPSFFLMINRVIGSSFAAMGSEATFRKIRSRSEKRDKPSSLIASSSVIFRRLFFDFCRWISFTSVGAVPTSWFSLFNWIFGFTSAAVTELGIARGFMIGAGVRLIFGGSSGGCSAGFRFFSTLWLFVVSTVTWFRAGIGGGGGSGRFGWDGLAVYSLWITGSVGSLTNVSRSTWLIGLLFRLATGVDGREFSGVEDSADSASSSDLSLTSWRQEETTRRHFSIEKIFTSILFFRRVVARFNSSKKFGEAYCNEK